MKKFLSIICASAIAVTGVAATTASSVAQEVGVGTADNILNVQMDRGDRRELRRDRREFREDRRDFRDDRREFRQDRREFRRDVRQSRRGFYRDNDIGYYNGYRGYRDRRAGYRQSNGYWFPAAAFVAGAIIGGAASQPSRTVVVTPGRLSQSHVDWCFDRYRSYRVSDNSFQPYNGPRQACYSPFS